MEELLKHGICLFDALCVAGYGTMTAMVYLSSVVPSLKDLASHGKTRVSQEAAAPKKKGVFGFLNNSEIFLVKKKRFRQFYIMGLIVATATLYLATTMRSNDDNNAQPSLLVASTVLLYLHMTRRLYECTFVHQWRETSVMHIAGYLVGAIHYVWLPLVFVRLPCKECVRTMFGNSHTSLLSDVLYAQYEEPLWVNNTELPSLVWRMPPILLCVWGQYQQYRHHVLLRQMRNAQSKKEDSTSSSTTKYSLPTGGWFQYVTCPHYLAEIIVYVSFAILLHQEQVQGGRHVLVLFWTASNLTLSALINYKWYKENLPAVVMQGRKAIVPFLL